MNDVTMIMSVMKRVNRKPLVTEVHWPSCQHANSL